MNQTAPTLREYFEKVFAPSLDCDEKVHKSYVRALDKFIAYRGTDPPLADVTQEAINGFRRWVIATNRGKASTADTHAKRLLHIVREWSGDPRDNGQGAPPAQKPNRVKKGDCTLATFLNESYLVERALKPETARQLRMSVNAFDRWHGRQVLLSELSDDLLNKWMIFLEDEKSPKTIKRRRGEILTIWRNAYVVGAAPNEPNRIRCVRVPRQIPEAFSMNELAAMLKATEAFDEYFRNGLHIGRFLFSFIHVAYDTALRCSDLFALEFKHIDAAGTVSIVQGKTGQGIICRIRPSTREAIDATLPPKRRLIFAWPYRRESFYGYWRRLLEAAGLPVDPKNGPHKLRRSSASYLERLAPGTAGIHLGHKSQGLAQAHYIDPRIAYAARPLPPAIEPQTSTT